MTDKTHIHQGPLSRLIFCFTLCASVPSLIAQTPAPGHNSFHWTFNGSAIGTAAFVDDLDDPIPHFSTRVGHHIHGSFRESELGLSFSSGSISGQVKVDFMGPGLELVTLSLTWRHGPVSILVGKDENLVATSEQTLFYDSYFTSGGIQTGARANIHQARISWRLTTTVTAEALVTDEKAVNGGPDGQTFSRSAPAMEAAIRWTNKRSRFRIAIHRGSMKLQDGNSFRPRLIMVDGSVFVSEHVRIYGTAFRKRAGSQFFPADTLLDYVYTPDGRIHEVRGHGSQFQLIWTTGPVTAWAGTGSFNLSNKSAECLSASRNPTVHALSSNQRFSIGLSIQWDDHVSVGAEYATFSTRHAVTNGNENGNGSIFLVKVVRSF